MQPTPIITFFEIPSVDFNRAIAFYQAVFKVELQRQEMEGIAMAIFPHSEGQATGAVVNGAPYTPSADGVCIYLYSTDFDAALQRIEQNGGTVVMPKTSICENGVIAMFIDSEGNRVGLHTMP